MNPQCPKCGGEMKYVAPGISKKGKPYPGFYSCKTFTCDGTYNPPKDAPQTHQNAPQAPIAPQVDNQHQVAQRAFIAELVDRVKKLETEQISLHKRICHLEDKDKPDYVPPTEEAKINDEIDVESIPF